MPSSRLSSFRSEAALLAAAIIIVLCLVIAPQFFEKKDLSQRHIIASIIANIDRPVPNNSASEYLRWIEGLQRQHDKLRQTLSPERSSLLYHLTLADRELDQFAARARTSITNNEPLLSGDNFFVYTRHISHLANAHPNHALAWHSEHIRVALYFLLLVIAWLLYKPTPILRKTIQHLLTTQKQRSALDQHIEENSDIAKFKISAKGHVLFINTRAEAMFQLPARQAKGQNISALISDESDSPILNVLTMAAESGQPLQLTGQRRSSGNFPCKLTAHPYTRAGESQLVLLIQDISELKAAEVKSSQTKKMEALGQLTGGIGHDFNNLLLVIKGNLKLLAEDLEGDEEKLELLDDALSAAHDGAQLTDRLLSFSRKQALLPESCNVNQLCQNFLRLVERAVGANIQVVLHPSLAPALVEVDPSQLQNALLNLSINARDAMPNGGHLSFTIKHLPVADIEQHLTAAPSADQYICISVSDTGSGMSESIQKKVFDPFFTTKETGYGTGMGLSMVYGFAQQSLGGVYINSKPGAGAKVNLLLPAQNSASKSPRAPAPKVQDNSTPRGNEHILVVEDEERVRKFTSSCLRSLGYQVTCADNSDLAHELLAQRDHGFDALFSDIIMPGNLNGEQLAHWVANNRRSIKILLTTGFSSTTHGDENTSKFPVLHKPFTKQELALKLRSVIEQY